MEMIAPNMIEYIILLLVTVIEYIILLLVTGVHYIFKACKNTLLSE